MNKHLLTDRRQKGGQCLWNGLMVIPRSFHRKSTTRIIFTMTKLSFRQL